MLEQLLNTPKHPNRELYSYLPVSTSLEQQLKRQAKQLLDKANSNSKSDTNRDRNFHDFIPNQQTENIQDQLIMLKLKGYMDKRNITSRNQQMKKLPSKVQVGRMIQGDPFIAAKAKIRQKKKQMNLTDYYLEMDKKEQFSTRKFSQIQRNKQRKKKITKKSLKKQQNDKFKAKGKSSNKNK